MDDIPWVQSQTSFTRDNLTMNVRSKASFKIVKATVVSCLLLASLPTALCQQAADSPVVEQGKFTLHKFEQAIGGRITRSAAMATRSLPKSISNLPIAALPFR